LERTLYKYFENSAGSHAVRELLFDFSFPVHDNLNTVCDHIGDFEWNDDDAIIVADNDIPWANSSTPAGHRHVDITSLLFRSSCGMCTQTENSKLHLL